MISLTIEKEFRDIYENHYNGLCNTAFRILQEKDTAREVVQEVFIDVWEKSDWKEIHSIKAYLYVAVHNRSLKTLRNKKQFVSEDEALHFSTVINTDIEDQELNIIVEQAIDSLPKKCKTIFMLSRESEMSYNSIATHLCLSHKTVENQMGIALKKLREYLQKYWF